VDEWRGDYFQEDAEEYRRPIVTHRYPFPMALFDAHLYPKGALVLHMVRDLTGDLGWWRGIAAYLDRHREATVVTADFQAAMEEATGVSLGPLFDQYVYGAGHPELAVRWGWIGDRRLVRVDVEQTQERTEETGLFSYPALELGLLGADGSLEIAAVPLEARERQSLYLPAAERPRTLVFDPRGVFLAEADFAKPTAEWAHQLTLTAYLPARLAAIRALARKGDAEAVAALGRVAAGDPFWGARAEAAEALGQVASREARAALEPALDDAESRVRREALEALGAFAAAGSTRPLLARLQRALQEDPSYYARAAAARALGRFARDRRQAAALLLAALEQDSHHQVVRAAALESLARLDEPRAWPEARRLAAYGAPAESRPAAMKALATLARGDAGRTGEALDLLLPWARGDRSAEAREGAYEALAALGDAAGLAVLDEVAAADIDPQQRRAAAAAAHELRRELAADGGLRRRVEELEGETRRLRGELAEVKGHR